MGYKVRFLTLTMKHQAEKSDYTYNFRVVKQRNFLMIEEISGSKKMSVTNNIENIIDFVIRRHKFDFNDYLYIYRDSEGIWDGFDVKKGDFIPLGESGWLQAANKMLSL